MVTVPAPGFALVFLSQNDAVLSLGEESETKTFATTAYTNVKNTVTVDPTVVATSNGHSGKDRALNRGSTSFGRPWNGGERVRPFGVGGVLVGGLVLVLQGIV